MSGSAIKAWLVSKQRKALFSSVFYFGAASILGFFALLPQIGVVFGIGKLLLLVAFPTTPHAGLFAGSAAGLWVAAVFTDCVRVERDDMSIIPLWLAREFFHLGPRLILEGWESMARARQFARIETAACAEVLAYLASNAKPVSKEELTRFFPWFVWENMVPQLLTIEGVILYRGSERLSLFAPLRLELRLLVPGPPPDTSREEPEPVPVAEPERLSAHEILGVPANASLAEIKTAYRHRMKECHPDRFTNTDEQSRALAEEWTKAINAAYTELLAQSGKRPQTNSRRSAHGTTTR